MKKVHSKSPMNVILAVDGSDHSRAAVDLLRALPFQEESSIHALGVLEPRAAPNSWALQAVLENTKTLLLESNVKVKTDLRFGYPAEILMAVTDQMQPDLIVIGAIGLRATLGILLGGVAQRVVEYACCPVLVVRAPFTGLDRVLLVTDGSRCSHIAADYLSNFALPDATKLAVMHVLPPTPSPEMITRSWPLDPAMISTYTEERPDDVNTRRQEEARAGQVILEKTVELFAEAGQEANSILRRGDAATEIIAYARESAIQLIVAGSRGLSQVSSWLLGSVSRKLVHYSNCSVLVVKSASPSGA